MRKKILSHTGSDAPYALRKDNGGSSEQDGCEDEETW